MLQLFGIYVPLARLYVYLKIIATRVCKKILFIKAKKILLGVPKFRTRTFIFEYLPTISSEMNSTHPFYTILIPMTSHAKTFILFIGGGAEPYKKFNNIKKLFKLWVVKRFFD